MQALTMGSPERPVPDSSNVIFPRRKQGQHKKHGRKEGVVVTMEILETVFHLPLHKACKDLVSCPHSIRIVLVSLRSVTAFPRFLQFRLAMARRLHTTYYAAC